MTSLLPAPIPAPISDLYFIISLLASFCSVTFYLGLFKLKKLHASLGVFNDAPDFREMMWAC